MTAIEFADDCLKRFGFIVVWYSEAIIMPELGSCTKEARGVEIGRPLTIVRLATKQEALKQLKLFELATGRDGAQKIKGGIPYVLVDALRLANAMERSSA